MPEPDTTKRKACYDHKLPVNETFLYKPGGFRPTHLGDYLNNRYIIVHKLGHGDDSTVWLASIDPPLTSGQSQIRYVTLKILRAALSTKITNQMNQELEILKYLRSSQNDASDSHGPHPGESKVLRLLDHFEVVSANGNHLVLVLPFRGFCLRDVRSFDPKWELDVKKRQSICKQISWGVAYLHKRGICHGDLTATNVVIGMDSLQKADLTKLYERIGKPDKIPFGDAIEDEQPLGHAGLKPTSGDNMGNDSKSSKPSYIVIAVDVFKLDGRLFGEKPNATIVDFGHAFCFGPLIEPLCRPNISIFYPAPESVYSWQVTEKIDIWFLACLIFQTRSGELLFQGPYFGGFKKGRDEDDAIKCWDEALGRATGFFILNKKNPTYNEVKKYTMADRGGPGSQNLRSIVVRTGGGRIVGEEIHWLWEAIAPMLRYNPDVRLSAADVVKSYYFTKWIQH